MIFSTEEILRRFQSWMDEAIAALGSEDATAMCLATADAEGRPSARMVLLKDADAQGFVFFTNYHSRKGRELTENPSAALCFHWLPLKRQVRVGGIVEAVDSSVSDDYFSKRPRASQLGALASAQSETLKQREELVARLEKLTRQYDGKPVPRPPHWGGYRLIPHEIEFWRHGDDRLHDRELFTRVDGDEWKMRKLNP